VSDVLAQALRLTVLGMGMTFASIAALALGMWGMTYLTRMRSCESPAEGGQENVASVGSDVAVQGAADPIGGVGEASDLAAAAAAATAVALALADQAEVREADAAPAETAPAETASADAAQAAAVAVAVSQTTQLSDVALEHQAPSEAWDTFVRGANLARRARYDARKPR
jgi:Na+-transporting methylmalonyl-CoA/oxaloacetate decarboxylase gamma subunit